MSSRKVAMCQAIDTARGLRKSIYSLRLFCSEEHCMGYVGTITKEVVGSPFEFELWAILTHPELHLTDSPSALIFVQNSISILRHIQIQKRARQSESEL